MRQILLTTLILDIFGCIVTGTFALFSEVSLRAFVYVALLTFGNILIPTFLGVLIFQIIKKKINFSNWTKTLIVQVSTMILVLILALFLWAIGDVLTVGDELTFENVKHDFYTQFFGFAIGGVFMAIAIPLVDRLLTKKKYVIK